MSSNTVYLVSGANRGIGLGLVKALVARDNVLVFAGARDVASASNLHAVSKAHPGKLHIVKLESASKEDGEAAAALVEKVAGHIDVIIANAGIADTWATAHEVPIPEVERHFKVNAVGPLVLFQAFYALLKAAPGTPKFVVISTFVGSIATGAAAPLGLSAYGPSKAAVNFITRKIHFENEHLISFSINPGAVDTDALKAASLLDPIIAALPKITVEQSVEGLLARVDEATREKTGGTFLGYEGDTIPW
ncbi:hypothetical protein PLICRDRAFT_119312 [Plicaturopsis crispa FD-325 SS-3]|uniref:NAD(P)-binding protein n=1 Tax=Plicaturopsis crispa FD-325 SS-3 TaxID=944288 RepID=A0A0C9SQA7_PLICR|nr:hypothetical protein PLICRDRAFT_119312 [Plicaturopsis crispa FD-325 SS-3]